MSAAATILATALAFTPVDAAPEPTYFLAGTDPSGVATVTDDDISWLLNGHLTGAQNVVYPRSSENMDASVDVGATAIVDILDEAEGPVRIAGVSQGALAIAVAKDMIMARDEEDRPEADDVVFVTIGDPSSPTGIGTQFSGVHVPFLGVTLQTAPETPYDTIIITREYDGLADFPDRPLNLLATLNALAGGFYVHPTTYGPDTDLDAIPKEDVTETVNSLGGKTTSYLFQNEHLPLLQPLRDLEVDEWIVAAIEQPLKQIVDAGYSRNDPKQSGTGEKDPDTATVAAADEDHGTDSGLKTRDRRQERKSTTDATTSDSNRTEKSGATKQDRRDEDKTDDRDRRRRAGGGRD